MLLRICFSFQYIICDRNHILCTVLFSVIDFVSKQSWHQGVGSCWLEPYFEYGPLLYSQFKLQIELDNYNTKIVCQFQLIFIFYSIFVH